MFLPTTARAGFLECTPDTATPRSKSSALLPQLIDTKVQCLQWFTGSHLACTPLLPATSLLDSSLPSLDPGTPYSSHQGFLSFISSKGSPALLILGSAWSASPVSLLWEVLLPLPPHLLLLKSKKLVVLLPLQSYHSSYHSGDWFHLPASLPHQNVSSVRSGTISILFLVRSSALTEEISHKQMVSFICLGILKVLGKVGRKWEISNKVKPAWLVLRSQGYTCDS